MAGFKVDHKQYKEEGQRVAFSPEMLDKINSIIKRYPEGKQKSALLPLLHIAQEEFGGYLSVGIQNYIASLLKLEPVEVYEVTSFYSQLYQEKGGKYIIEICHTGPCAICGGEKISEYLRKKLKLETGMTTGDGIFTLREVECLGACGYAPAMQINMEFYENLTEEKIDEILENLRNSSDTDKSAGSKWADKFF
jgi:NADH-quinone oxidoreductase subunit E